MATEQTEKLVTITSKAAEKIKEFMTEEEEKPQFLRIYVQGGGCSGLSYGMGFEKEAEEDVLRLAGVGDEEITDTVFQKTKRRFNWLLLNLFTALISRINLFRNISVS